MSESSDWMVGADTQAIAALAGQVVSGCVRTTLGPNGMHTMLLSKEGRSVTNDGVTILQKLVIEHPIARAFVDIADSQSDTVGDGTTTAVLLAGELVKHASALQDHGLHPQTILQGYADAADEALRALQAISTSIDITDREDIAPVAATALSGSGFTTGRERLVDVTLSTVDAVTRDGVVDLDDVAFEAVPGWAVTDTRVLRGVLVNRDPVHPGMPDRLEACRIGLFDCDITPPELTTDTSAIITEYEDIHAQVRTEQRAVDALVERIREYEVDVIVCEKSIDDHAIGRLADAGILALRRVRKSDMQQVKHVTGATVVSDVTTLTPESLGWAESVERTELGDADGITIESGDRSTSVTVLTGGGTSDVATTVERGIDSATHAVLAARSGGGVVPGGGAAEMAVSMWLRDHAQGIGGREQLAVQSFAEALEVIPGILAQNSGVAPIDALVELRNDHGQREHAMGVSQTGEIVDMREHDVVDPTRVKHHAIVTAHEMVDALVRIDDIIAGSTDTSAASAGGSDRSS